MSSVAIVLRRDKINSIGETPIYFRIIKDRKVSYISTNIKIIEEYWDEKKLCVKSKHPNSKRFNSYLSNKFAELQDSVFQFETEQKSLTTRQLKDKIYGQKPTSFFAVADEILQGFIAKGKIGTHDRFASVINKLREYAKGKDYAFQEIDVDFIKKYEHYLRSVLNNKTNTVYGNMKFIRQVFNYAYDNEIIDHSLIPFNKYKLKKEKTERVYLHENEIKQIEEYSSDKYTKINLHRDMFVFACYTGLRISDMLQLKWKNFDGTHLNFIIRKTTEQSSIKVPQKGLDILSRMQLDKPNPDVFIFQMLPPELDMKNDYAVDKAISASTAYINKNLKTIETEIKLTKHISFHIARHTFATLALRKGVTIDKVSKLLGHAQIRETQIYAKIVNSELDKAMDVFND